MEYCLQAVYNSVTKVAGRRERAVAVGEDENKIYLEKESVVMSKGVAQAGQGPQHRPNMYYYWMHVLPEGWFLALAFAGYAV